MEIEVITKEDLQQFRIELLNDLRQMLKPAEARLFKPWLKHSEVRNLLSISSNTLQRLRISGKLPSKKIGGIHYYRYEDIQKLLTNDEA
jgi:predicted site-specific integrase-resolvase